jgi:tetratricopeptide (TPR) repeat protein
MPLATPISRGVLGLAALLLLASPQPGGAATVTHDQLFAYARTNLLHAQAAYHAAPTNIDAAWQLARACFDMGEFSTNRAQRAAFAEEGIAACREALTRQSNSAPCYYYLGMTLGELAQTKGFAALALVRQMEQVFTRARELDERLDWAGPDRNLGLLYREAPSIGSIGSRSKARSHLQRAVELAPDYPENRLNLLEAYLKWGDRTNAQVEFKALEQLWPTAHTRFTGIAWTSSWAQWEALYARLRLRLSPPKPIDAPHEKE